MRALALCALAACSYPEKIMTDAAGPPFGCLNAPPPTTADDPIIVTGTTTNPFTGGAISGVAVAGQVQGIAPAIFTVHSDATGKFRQSQATGRVPMDLYAHASANGFLDAYYYPPHLVTRDVVFDLALFTAQDSMTLASAAQLTFNPADGQVVLTVADCNGTPLAGATVTTSPAATIRYFNNVTPSATATATDSRGLVLVANVPPGNLMLSATVNGMALKSHNLQIVANSMFQTFIQP